MAKRISFIILLGVGLLAVSGAASADGTNMQEGSQQQTENMDQSSRSALIFTQKPSQVLTSSLIGMSVRNKAETIGTISNLIMNKKYKIVGMVVDMSGMTGLISKSVGLSWAAVKHIDPEKGVVLVDASKPQLQSMRSFTTQKELQQE